MLSAIHFASLQLSMDFHPHLVSPLRVRSPLPAWRLFNPACSLPVLRAPQGLRQNRGCEHIVGGKSRDKRRSLEKKKNNPL